MKLKEFLNLLPWSQPVEISIMGKDLYEGDVRYYEQKDYEIDEVYTYGDIKDYDKPFAVICIDCKESDSNEI